MRTDWTTSSWLRASSEEDKLHLSRILPDTRLYNFYGSTEAGCSCLLDFNSMSGKPGCIGKPAKNAHFIVVDENKNEIDSSLENPGFLASSGSINMKCYFNAPELTDEATGGGSRTSTPKTWDTSTMKAISTCWEEKTT